MAKAKLRVVANEEAPPKATVIEYEWRFWWDDDAKRPMPLTHEDLADDDTRQKAEGYKLAYLQWMAAQRDPDEAAARAAYGEHAARHLMGVFPGARVSDAYAVAAGEELGRYSVDIIKAMATHVRRTAKSLPPIAGLLEACAAECALRCKIADHCAHALSDYRRAIRQGEERAAKIAERLTAAGIEPAPDAAMLLEFYEAATLYPLGIIHSDPGFREQVAARLLKRLENADAEMARAVVTMTEARRAFAASVSELPDGPEHWGVWDQHDEAERGALLEIGDRLGVPRPQHFF